MTVRILTGTSDELLTALERRSIEVAIAVPQSRGIIPFSTTSRCSTRRFPPFAGQIIRSLGVIR